MIWETLKKAENPLDPTVSPLSEKARGLLQSLLGDRSLIPLSVTSSTASPCGTRKMLYKLEVKLDLQDIINLYRYCKFNFIRMVI